MMGLIFLLFEVINCIIIDTIDTIRRHKIMNSVNKSLGIKVYIGSNVRTNCIKRSWSILITLIIIILDDFSTNYNNFEQFLLVLCIYFSMRFIISFLHFYYLIIKSRLENFNKED